MKQIVAFLLLLTAPVVLADNPTLDSIFQSEVFDRLHYFPDAADMTKLVVEFRNNDLLPGNTCNTTAECEKLYRLEYEGENHSTFDVTSVVLGDSGLGHTLTFTLGTPVTTIKDLVLTCFNVKAQPKLGQLRIVIAPQLKTLPTPDTLTFEGIHSPVLVQYQALLPNTLNIADQKKAQALLANALGITDPGEFNRAYRGYVGRVGKSKGDFVYTLLITGAPRGKAVNVQVGGIESFGATPLTATTSVQTMAAPKGRDDAALFLRIGAEANDIKHERKYTLDVRARDTWRSGERWQIGPTLDVNIGNKTAKAPNLGSLAADFRYFFPGNPNFRSRLLISPIFRTDRAFENEDLGVDLVWEMIIPRLDQSLDARRRNEKNLGGPPLARVWGWSVRPVIALEVGRRIKSVEEEVDGSEFSRLRGGLSMTLERGRWKLSVSAVERHLFSEEAVIEGDTVVTTAASDRHFVRGDLTYDVGIIGVTLTHMDGRQPPAFSDTHSTSLGVTFKF